MTASGTGTASLGCRVQAPAAGARKSAQAAGAVFLEEAQVIKEILRAIGTLIGMAV